MALWRGGGQTEIRQLQMIRSARMGMTMDRVLSVLLGTDEGDGEVEVEVVCRAAMWDMV